MLKHANSVPFAETMGESDTNDNTYKNDLDISNLEQKEEELQEINFDQLLGEANQHEADFEEDRDDDDVSDEEDSQGDDHLGDSLAFSKTNDLQEIVGSPPREEATASENNMLNSQAENAMWDMVISKHGKKEFDTCYHIIGKFKNDRFSETAQKQIQVEASAELSKLGMSNTTKQQELIGLVSSYMILEEYKTNSR